MRCEIDNSCFTLLLFIHVPCDNDVGISTARLDFIQKVCKGGGGGQKLTFEIFAGMVSYHDKIAKWQPKSGGFLQQRG